MSLADTVAAKLLLGIKHRDQARLVAARAPDGYWEVRTDFQHGTAAQEAQIDAHGWRLDHAPR